MGYSHQEIEKKWQEYWTKNQTFFTDLADKSRPKKYILAMFPYPSGSGLHVGHIRNYTITDALARYYRLKGYNVLMPIGWDSFGLPAEQYAIQTGNHPATFTDANIKNFKQQLLKMGFSYDWSKEINTSDPDYYHWTQWIFGQIYQQGLAEYKEIPVYWCEKLGTVLANEEIKNVKGKKVSERGNFPVIEKKIPQWVLKITQYAPQLLAGLKDLDWPTSIKSLQTNWIGLSQGTIIYFPLVERVELVCENVSYCSDYDEETFFEWIKRIKCISKIKGIGTKLYLFINENEISDKDLRELLGLFYRYKIDMSQLAVFLDKKNKSWFFDNPKGFWHQKVFSGKERKNAQKESQVKYIPVFTTRPDTIFGVVAIALSINHPLISEITLPEQQKKVADFCEYWSEKKENREIAGEFTGSYCVNPLSNEKIPVWITNFVISDYGTGAVMIAPYFSDERAWDKKIISQDKIFTEPEKKQNRETDFAFAKKYELLKAKPGVIRTYKKNSKNKSKENDWCWYYFETCPQCYHFKYKGFTICGTFICHCVKKNFLLNKEDKNEAIEIINQEIEKKQAGKRTEVYHLKDWIFSRQRYWGEPIPIIHWEDNTQTILLENELPLLLPPLTDFAPNPNYSAPLQKVENWVNIERKDGLKGKREVNVMPQWAGSCWYYIAFLLRRNNSYLALNSPEAKEITKNWLPVDIYIGGQEHATLHLLYARFWHKILAKIGMTSQPEPFQKFICQGMILGEDGEKMSKSRGNVINPDELVEKYGADALRIYEVFLGPTEHTANFDINTVRAMKKWLDRVHNFSTLYKEAMLTNVENEEIKICYYETVKKVDNYYQNVKLNLVVSSLMKFINKCYKVEGKFMRTDYFLGFLKLLSPLAPHLSEELWSHFYQENSISKSEWPQIEEKWLNTLPSQINITVQINGQKKVVISISKGKNQKEIEELAQNDPKIKNVLMAHKLAGQKITKIVYIKDKLINFVILQQH